MLSDNELQELKIRLVAFIDSITKEEFINCEIEHGYDEIGLGGYVKNAPNGIRTLTIKISRPNRPETDPNFQKPSR